MKRIRNIVIVGGGTAGWLAAGIIAAGHQARRASGFTVTLVESPTTPIIGVGEGTWPTLRTTLSKMGVSETEFFRECDAAFKQGARFDRWTTGAADDGYYHPLVLPQGFGEVDLASHWLHAPGGDSFCDAVCAQGVACDAGLAPKTIATREYDGLLNYAYHLDAGKFADFLKRHCKGRLGVRHVLADVRNVRLDGTGDIAGVVTEQAGEITGDLFVDCTGFRSLLLGGAMQVPFRDCGDVLFCDTALAVQLPYDTPDAPIASHTISTAQSAGWIWDIGLPTRRGTGHVYSSRHIGEAEAEAELRRYIGAAYDHLPIRKIAIHAGHRERFWVRNCVAIGLSAGFLEPLEASAIMLIELSAKIVAEQMPATRDTMDIVAARFDEVTHYRWGRIIDFLKLHYALSQRTDTAFWRDNRDPATMSPRLRDLLALWRYRPPSPRDDFDRLDEVFPAASYQYVLYGMGYATTPDRDELVAAGSRAARSFDQNRRVRHQLCKRLPANRELLRKIAEHGMQTI